MTPPPPVPKPRTRYSRDSAGFLDSNLTVEGNPQAAHLSTGNDAPPPPSAPGGSTNGVVFPTLAGITNIIATNIPSLAGLANSIGGSAPNSSPSQIPSAPPSIDAIASDISANIPSLAGAVSAVASPAAASVNSASDATPAANKGTAKLDSIVSSLANIPSISGIVNTVTTPATPSAPPTSDGDSNTGVKQSPYPIREEDPYISILASWASQEEVDTDSSNEEEDQGSGPASTDVGDPTGGDPTANLPTNTNNLPLSPSGRLVPTRPAPPPPLPPNKPVKPSKQKTPRAATIRVSRKKGGSKGSTPQSAVVRSSWLDVWKGFRHSVLWATLDGQLMSLWKKRTDRFSELLFHVSSITNVKKQDKGRFSVYFRKKHYDFMAHNDEVHEGWVTSLLATRGQTSPAPPETHGQLTMKDPRSRVYAAVWGHDLWIYPNKEGFQLGIASYSVPLNVASVKSTGKHSFTLITPYRTFNLSVDSSKDLSSWLESLNASIRSALSCSLVAQRLWENPDNKVCGDCGSANPEWASVNLLLVICESCAGLHRALGSSLSKVRSLKMDNKVWTEPLIQLFVAYGNRLANQIWAPAVPAVEQLRPDSSEEERLKFIQDKYSRGRYRRVHALASSDALMDQRLRQVVCGDDVEETMSLICSGAKVRQTDPQNPSPVHLAERANQALQTELLRLNEYTDVPPANRRPDSALSGEEVEEEGEELHGKLEDDRFLFSLENTSAACDVLDLREVLSVFVKHGAGHQFEMVTLNDQLICEADDQDALQSHLVHILKVILPGGVSYAEVGGASAASKVSLVGVGGASSEAWLLLWEDGVSVHPVNRNTQQPVGMELSTLSRHEMNQPENIITLGNTDRSVSVRFEEQHSCQSWFDHLQKALTNQKTAPQRPPATANHSSLYPQMDLSSRGTVPAAIQRCISHITTHGLKVEGVYRRCGIASKVSRLVEALMTSPISAPLESDEQGVLDVSSALKQYVRQQESLIPDKELQQWLHAAGVSDERSRFNAYRRLLRQLPDDNRATLNALFGHFYM
ncbi:arf-GAP with Rho-GAP domain%2C ANK repeat and PH domain-containing protein 1 [Xyrichtys novacula]|nr:arf-GAP with Rho-GAP domain%2C ANK repeat and PH domain-containing protein 1 [Xyrichtys novacula]